MILSTYSSMEEQRTSNPLIQVRILVGVLTINMNKRVPMFTITNKEEYEKALKELSGLFDLDPDNNPAIVPRFLEVCEAVYEYESIHYPIEEPSREGFVEYNLYLKFFNYDESYFDYEEAEKKLGVDPETMKSYLEDCTLIKEPELSRLETLLEIDDD